MTDQEAIANNETRKHIARVNALLHTVAKALLDRGIAHDASKLVEPESETFAVYTEKLKGLDYGSDEYKQCLDEMAPTLEHHYANNRHHPEHFAAGIEDMTLIDLVEMLCDWKAASERHNTGNILKSIELNRARFGIDRQLSDVLVNTVKAMGFAEAQA